MLKKKALSKLYTLFSYITLQLDQHSVRVLKLNTRRSLHRLERTTVGCNYHSDRNLYFSSRMICRRLNIVYNVLNCREDSFFNCFGVHIKDESFIGGIAAAWLFWLMQNKDFIISL